MIKTILKILVGIFGLVVLLAAGVMAKASLGLSRQWEIAARQVPQFTADSVTLARGAHLASAIMKCVDCHGPDLGGKAPFADAGALGVVNSSNLTRGEGGVIDRYDDAALARAIRHGVKVDGRPILIMPAANYNPASDADVGAVIAYVRSMAPVDRVIPPSTVRPLGRMLYGAGMFPIVEADLIDHATAPLPDLAPAGSVEYGRYLASIGGCIGCHGPGLSGGKIPGAPPDWKPATNITPAGLNGWTEADLVTALRTGIRPNKTPIDTLMPWRLAGQMDSTEMRAVWLFLQSVPGRPYGGR